MIKCTVNFSEDKKSEIKFESIEAENKIQYMIDEKIDCSKVQTTDFWLNDFEIKAGDEGYFVMPGGCQHTKFKDSGIGYFKEHSDVEYISPHALMPNFGLKHKGGTFIAFVTGMPG